MPVSHPLSIDAQPVKTYPLVNVICFDLDGTLVDESGRIHPKDIQVLQNKPEDVVFIPASGRSLTSVRKVFTANGLFEGGVFPFPLILQNGSLVYDAEERLLGFFPFEECVQDLLIKIAIGKKGVTYLFMAQDRIDRIWAHPFSFTLIEKYGFIVQPYNYAGDQLAFSKVMCLSDRYNLLLEIQTACEGLEVDKAFSMPTIFELTPKGINKGSGLKFLLESTGQRCTLVSAAGNDQNDFSMLQLADLKFAPVGSNAVSLCKSEMVIDPENNGILTPMLEKINSMEEK